MENGLLSLKWNNHKTTFFEILKILREKSIYTDATLSVEGKFYPVHKLVMSTCSEYFSEIFERTPCKSPVIVFKDVRRHDIEALLDYMYLGEVNVNQNDLPSLLKAAECLRIKGLAVPDEDPTKLHKNSNSSHEARRDSPPPKRRRHESNTIHPRAASPVSSSPKNTIASVYPTQTTPMPPHSTSNTSYTEKYEPPFVKVKMDNGERSNTKQNEPPVVKVEMDAEESNTVQDEPPHSTSNTYTEQYDPPFVKVEMSDAEEQEERFTRENYEGSASSDRDPWWDYTEYEPEKYGNSFPGPSLQQSVMDSTVDMHLDEQYPDINDFQWTKQSIFKLIELYRELPCLWQIKNQAYKDRNERTYAYKKIQEAFPNVSLEAIKKKINILRTQYRRELKLYLLSKKSGAGADQIYKPRLWFYEYFHFLSEGEVMRDTISTIDETLVESVMDSSVDMNSDEQNPDIFDFGWTKQSILKLIEMYRDLPCLWQVKSQAYKDRYEKASAYKKIQEAFPNLSLEAIKKKINTIRTQYRRELKLYQLSKKSGTGADQLYKPRLWFFDHINFLSEGDMRETASTFDEMLI